MKKAIKLLSYLIVLSISAINVMAQDPVLGLPQVEYFGTQDYNAGIQNFSISQDYRGTILVANNQGMLQYDGSEWRKYNIGSSSRIRAVLPAIDGKIYVGAQNELGYFFPGQDGEYVYHSLMELVPSDDVEFDDVWNIFPTDNGCIFSSFKEMLIYDGNGIEIVQYPKLNTIAFQLNNKIYKHVEGEGLMHYSGSEWKLHKNTEFFASMNISSLVSFSNDRIMVGTTESGIFLVDKYGVIPWSPEFQNIFKEHRVNKVIGLKNGSIAVGTNSNGLYVFQADGKLVNHLTKDRGLKNRTVLDIFEDKFGNIWVGHNNGISKIELNSPFSYINEEMDLPGTGYSVLDAGYFNYFGTNNGLYYSTDDKAAIYKVTGIEGTIYDINLIGDDVLVAGHSGAFQLHGSRAIEISSGVGWWTFAETNSPDVVIAGGYAGLFLLEKEAGSWKVMKHYDDFFESSRVMAFDDKGTLWMTHGYKGVYSFDFSEDLQNIEEIKFYDKNKGFPSNWFINVFRINGEMVFAAEKGIYTYNAEKDTFLLHNLYQQLFDPDLRIRGLVEDNFGDIYFIGDLYSGRLLKNNWGYEMDSILFLSIHKSINDDLERISLLDNNKIVVAMNDGFAQFDNTFNFQAMGELKTMFRNVKLLKSDSVMVAGNFVENGVVVNSQPLSLVPKLPFTDNSIAFSFTAMDFHTDPAQYRYQLLGFDKNWSDWNSKPVKEYTNLFEGEYSFQFEGKNAYGFTAPIETYKFVINPPWYRTITAYVFYFILSVSSAIIIVYFNRKHRHLIAKQGIELDFKDKDLKEVSRRSEEEIGRLKNEKLTNEIRHKKRELATSTMHLIDKNDFINSIKTRVVDLSKVVQKREVDQKLKRIVKEIDKNIAETEEDWSQFEIHFDEVHEGFIRKLKDGYPFISSQELKLCAYLRMNMRTKEIANLLSITPRGVEMSRYRLRKKLKLGKSENLVDFMMRI